MRKARGFLVAAVVTLLTSATAPVYATATLDAWLSDFACSFTDETGLTSGIPCNGASVTAPLGPGDAVMITATLNYTYHDDGLALADPRAAWIQMDANGFTLLRPNHEVGWILVFGARCDNRYCAHPPGLYELGTATFPPIVLGLNDVADDLSGQMQVSAGYSVEPAPFIGGAAPTASLSLATYTHSVAAPIPEPATSALLAAGLAMLGIGWQRRRVR